MSKLIELNKTNQVVKQATKIAARDVMAPKVVRNGIVHKVSKSSNSKNQ